MEALHGEDRKVGKALWRVIEALYGECGLLRLKVLDYCIIRSPVNCTGRAVEARLVSSRIWSVNNDYSNFIHLVSSLPYVQCLSLFPILCVLADRMLILGLVLCQE